MKTLIALVGAALVTDASAIKSQAQIAANLIMQARNMISTNSEAYTHLTNALGFPLPSVAAPKAGPSETQLMDKHSQLVDVPIDEKRALTLKVSPTYALDEVNSVTLKSFRKIVGYDTFESIRKKNRNESKDISDYYNVTVSMMIKRKPAEVSPAPPRDPYNPEGSPNLASTLDKGFPYDD